MASSKASPALPLSDAEVAAARAEGRYCEMHQRAFVNIDAKKFHDERSADHRPSASPGENALSGTPVATPAPRQSEAEFAKAVEVETTSTVTFLSARAPALRIQFKPTRIIRSKEGGGEVMDFMEGIEIEFQNGRFETDDPKIIAYLEGNRPEAKRLGVVDKSGKPRVYDDPRYPVISSRQHQQMVQQAIRSL